MLFFSLVFVRECYHDADDNLNDLERNAATVRKATKPPSRHNRKHGAVLCGSNEDVEQGALVLVAWGVGSLCAR